jgi:hypothetical protein
MVFSTCSFGMNLFGQITKFEDMPQEILEQMDKMGIDNCPFLTELESNYFNILFQNRKKDFDFRNKKIAFITGSSGKTISDKQEYFAEERISLQRNSTPNQVQLLIFNAEQKEVSGGYDGAIVYWSKFVMPVEKIVKRLSEKR